MASGIHSHPGPPLEWGGAVTAVIMARALLLALLRGLLCSSQLQGHEAWCPGSIGGMEAEWSLWPPGPCVVGSEPCWYHSVSLLCCLICRVWWPLVLPQCGSPGPSPALCPCPAQPRLRGRLSPPSPVDSQRPWVSSADGLAQPAPYLGGGEKAVATDSGASRRLSVLC